MSKILGRVGAFARLGLRKNYFLVLYLLRNLTRGRNAMRNTITSFVKNEICRFANEADQVLRAIADPAASVVRIISTAVTALLGYQPHRRLRLPETTGTSAIASIFLGQMPGKDIGSLGQRGFDRWSGLWGQPVS